MPFPPLSCLSHHHLHLHFAITPVPCLLYPIFLDKRVRFQFKMRSFGEINDGQQAITWSRGQTALRLNSVRIQINKKCESNYRNLPFIGLHRGNRWCGIAGLICIQWHAQTTRLSTWTPHRKNSRNGFGHKKGKPVGRYHDSTWSYSS